MIRFKKRHSRLMKDNFEGRQLSHTCLGSDWCLQVRYMLPMPGSWRGKHGYRTVCRSVEEAVSIQCFPVQVYLDSTPAHKNRQPRIMEINIIFKRRLSNQQIVDLVPTKKTKVFLSMTLHLILRGKTETSILEQVSFLTLVLVYK